MSRDTVDRCLGASLHFRAFFWEGLGYSAGLEVSGGVQGELADELSGVAVDDPDVQVVDEQGDRVPARRRPRPMWCRRLLCRRVTALRLADVKDERVTSLAHAVVPLIRTRSDLYRYSAANAHGRDMHDAIDILEAAIPTTDPAEIPP